MHFQTKMDGKMCQQEIALVLRTALNNNSKHIFSIMFTFKSLHQNASICILILFKIIFKILFKIIFKLLGQSNIWYSDK